MSKEKASSRINNRINGSALPKKKASPVMLLFPVLIVVAIAGGVIFMLNGKEPEAKNVVVTPENVQDVIKEMQEEEKTPAGSYEVAMTTEWHFPDGSSAAKDAYVENAVTNTNTVFFTIALANSTEDIYKSPFIEVGSYLTNIALDTPLSKGTYDAVVTYHLVDDSNKELSKVSVAVTLIIEQ